MKKFTKQIIFFSIALAAVVFLWLNFVGNPPNITHTTDTPLSQKGQKQIIIKSQLQYSNIAEKTKQVQIKADENPQNRMEFLDQPEPPQNSVKRIPPKIDMDIQNPPQWTKTIAAPAANPVPPDPNQEPELKVDPTRKPEPEVKRLTVGKYEEVKR